MVRSYPARHLVAIFVCLSFFSIHADGAILYDQPRRLSFDRHLEVGDTPNTQTDTISLENLNGFTRGGEGISWDEAERSQRPDATHSMLSSSRSGNNGSPGNHLQAIGRLPPSLYASQKYIMVPPEENILRELVLNLAARAETRGLNGLRRDMGLEDYTLPHSTDDKIELKLPNEGLPNGRDWTYQENSPLYVKPKRLYQQLPQELQKGQARPQYMREAVSPTEPRVTAAKRWWGGYHRPRAQMDRRASQSKHYDCLKSCIKEGKLHPIQCHTLC